MITNITFVPSTPLLIPAVASGAAHELDEMRALAVGAVSRATRAADDVVIVGSGPSTRLMSNGIGSMRAFGVPVDLRLGGGSAEPIGLAGTIGLWLLEQAAWQGQTYVQQVAQDLADLSSIALTLGSGDGSRALLVVGDGSAARTEKAPGYLHADAESFDGDVERALRTADISALQALDPERARTVMAAGWPAWRAAAAALAGVGAEATATLNYAGAPYGVGYFVAEWHVS